METIILNPDFEQIGVSALIHKLKRKKLCVFGASKNNIWLYNYGLKEEIKYIFDNDESKWGKCIDNISIIKPEFINDSIVITVLADLTHVIPQIREMGYSEFYFVVSFKKYEKFFAPELQFYSESDMNFVWENQCIKYVHVIPDQKFVLPLVDIIEKGFQINEHSFLIYNFNRENNKDKYHIWNLYRRLHKHYRNIAIFDGVFSYDKKFSDRIIALNRGLLDCIKVVIHGEWLSDFVFEYLSKNLDVLVKKGVLIPWSGTFGHDNCNKKYIEGLLKYCNTICLDEKNDCGKELIRKLGLRAKKYIYNGLNYSQPVILPHKTVNKIPKVLVGHSCYPYNRVAESLNIISKFVGEIEVYCITSYGDEKSILEAERVGKTLFGDKFFSVKNYMKYEEYVLFLNKIDVAVYAMEVGGGNTTLQLLCYMGTKLFFKKNTNTYNYAKSQGYYVHDYYTISEITLEKFVENTTRIHNYNISKKNFSLEEKTLQWKEVLT